MSAADDLRWLLLRQHLRESLLPLPSGEALAKSDGTRYVEQCHTCGWRIALVANSNTYAEPGDVAHALVALPMASTCPRCGV